MSRVLKRWWIFAITWWLITIGWYALAFTVAPDAGNPAVAFTIFGVLGTPLLILETVEERKDRRS
jgi:hypothetical protein